MKHTLLYTLSFFTIATFMTACSTTQLTDEMAVVGNPSLASDPCAAIDEKVLKLDRFTEVVKHTSAFYLEEKANAIPTPGITVSNNRKQMLRDAEKKYAQYAAERQKYGCETPVKTDTAVMAEQMPILNQCAALEAKVFQLDRFTEVVKHTSAFYLEEKANAIETPGITVSNNKKQMLRDAEKKYAEYAAEHKKYGCKTPITTSTSQIPDKIVVTSKPAYSSESSAVAFKESIKPIETTSQVSNSTVVDAEVRSVAAPVQENTPSMNKEQMTVAVPQTQNVEASAATSTAQMDEKTTTSDDTIFSSEKCNSLDEELIELSQFTSMVKNTSAFHLEEKASALPSPGFTVSNNKKKMLRDIEKRHAELLAERKKYGCDPL